MLPSWIMPLNENTVPLIGLFTTLAILAAGGLLLRLNRTGAAASPRLLTPSSSSRDVVRDGDSRLTWLSSRQAGGWRRGSPLSVLVQAHRSGGLAGQAWVIGRSDDGFCLKVGCDGALVGDELRVRPYTGGPATPWVELRVQKVRFATDGWELDCRFLHTPTFAVRLLFG